MFAPSIIIYEIFASEIKRQSLTFKTKAYAQKDSEKLDLHNSAENVRFYSGDIVEY